MLDDVLETFVTPATIFVCLGVYVLTYFVRTLAEGLWPAVKANHYWTEVALPLGPIVNGALMGLMAKSVLWPDMFNRTLLSRCIYGSICGLFSAFLYSRVRSWISSRTETA